jgi:hypothetical protein
MNLLYISEVHQVLEWFKEYWLKSSVRPPMYLTAKETLYAIITGFAALTILMSIIIFWAYQQPSCWDLHASEEQAIINCEQ